MSLEKFRFRSPAVVGNYRRRNFLGAIPSEHREMAGVCGAIAVAFGALYLASQKFMDEQVAIAVSDFAKKVTEKLDGIQPFEKDEKILARVVIIPAGRNAEEERRMRAAGTPVNLRDFPSKFHANSRDTRILGTIPQGTTIDHVLVTKGLQPDSPNVGYWIAFRSSSIRGPIFNNEGKEITLDPNVVCAVYARYTTIGNLP